MAVRVGIELSPAACRIVVIDGGAWRRRWSETRVRSFAVLPPGGSETEAKLASLRKAVAAVVVWGVPSDHRQVMVTDGSYERMRREALASLAGVGLETGGVLADIAATPRRGDDVERRSVVVAVAAAPMISAALAPLVAAGIDVRTVMTPPAALASLGRMRRASAAAQSIEAYVALEETATCIALLRDGALIAARELGWGFVDRASGHTRIRHRDKIAERLGKELSQFFASIGAPTSAVSQICVCGGLPELRSMTVGLTERLDIEVEPLDSLFGIDASRMPKRADEFRERSADLRLAWAAVADSPATINLLRAQRRHATKGILSRAAVVSGVAAGLGIGWGIERTDWWQSIVAGPQTRTAENARRAAPSPRPPAITATPPAAPQLPMPSATAKATTPAPALPPAVKTPAPPVGPTPSQLPLPVPATPTPSPARVAPPLREPVNAPGTPAAPVARIEPRPTQSTPRPTAQVPAPPLSTARTPGAIPLLSPSPPGGATPAAPRAEVILPFEATLGTILYSPDRKLAIIDGRIVGVGDEIRGARVTDITASAVFLRDAQGRLRHLALGVTGR